jgi:hypothetical protein
MGVWAKEKRPHIHTPTRFLVLSLEVEGVSNFEIRISDFPEGVKEVNDEKRF